MITIIKKCEHCGSTDYLYINNKFGHFFCDQCYNSLRYNIKTNIDPKSITGLNVISRYVISNVLQDCKPSILTDYSYGLQSDTLGRIHVKCDELAQYKHSWAFRELNAKYINYYYCLAFDKNRTEILHVWEIPADEPVLRCGKIRVYTSKSSLKRLEEYELDMSIFNEAYYNINISYIPEFENYLPDRVTAPSAH